MSKISKSKLEKVIKNNKIWEIIVVPNSNNFIDEIKKRTSTINPNYLNATRSSIKGNYENRAGVIRYENKLVVIRTKIKDVNQDDFSHNLTVSIAGLLDTGKQYFQSKANNFLTANNIDNNYEDLANEYTEIYPEFRKEFLKFRLHAIASAIQLTNIDDSEIKQLKNLYIQPFFKGENEPAYKHIIKSF